MVLSGRNVEDILPIRPSYHKIVVLYCFSLLSCYHYYIVLKSLFCSLFTLICNRHSDDVMIINSLITFWMEMVQKLFSDLFFLTPLFFFFPPEVKIDFVPREGKTNIHYSYATKYVFNSKGNHIFIFNVRLIYWPSHMQHSNHFSLPFLKSLPKSTWTVWANPLTQLLWWLGTNWDWMFPYREIQHLLSSGRKWIR